MRWLWLLCTALCCLTCALMPASVFAQETENITPPPMLFLAPVFNLEAAVGEPQVIGGVDVALAIPLNLRTSLTGSRFLNIRGSDSNCAHLNYDIPIGTNSVLRSSVGFWDDIFGYGITAHRAMADLGYGLFARNVDDNLEMGVLLTTPINWGVKLRRVRAPKSDTRWYSSGGSVGTLGARVALTYRDIEDNGDVLATGAAFFPMYEHRWPRAGGSAQWTSATGADFLPPAHLAWCAHADAAVRTGAAVFDGVAYVGSQDEWLYAFSLRDGKLLWRFPANSPITSAPSVADGRIYFGTDGGELFCIRPPVNGQVPAGTQVWRYETDAALTGSPLVTGTGLVFFGAADGRMYALEKADGKLRWRRKTGGPIVAGVSKGLYQIPAGLDEDVNATSRAGAVLCASTDGTVYAYAETTGELVWSLDTGAPLTAAPAIRLTTAYVGNYAGKILALSVSGGHVKWTTNVDGPIVSAPAVTPEMLCVATRDGEVFAFSTNNGARLWHRSLPAGVSGSPTIVADRKLYVACRDGYVRALDLDTGEVVWDHFAGEALATGPAIAEDHMIIGGDRGGVYGYRKGKGKSLQVAYASERPLPATAVPVPATTQQPQASLQVETPATATPGPSAPTTRPVVTPPPTTTPPVIVSFPKPTVSTGAGQPGVAPSQRQPSVGGTYPPEFPTADTTVGPKTTETDRTLGPATTAPGTGQPTVVQPPTTTTGPSMPPEDDDPLHMTLQIEPAAGDEALLVSNRSYVYVGGAITDPSSVAGIEVNGTPVAVEDDHFLHREQFTGPGSYLMRVTATSTQGVTSERVRRVRIISPSDAEVPEIVRITARPSTESHIVTFVVGLGGKIARQRIVAEIQDADGSVMQRWTHPGAGPFLIEWNGMGMSEQATAPGQYMAVFAMFIGDQMLTRIRQPIRLDY